MLHIRHLAGELLQAKFRLLTAFGTCFAARAALRRVRAFAARLPPACSERGLHLDLGEPSCFAAGRRRARDEAGYTLTLPSALTRNPRLRGRSTWRRSMTFYYSCLSAASHVSRQGTAPRGRICLHHMCFYFISLEK